MIKIKNLKSNKIWKKKYLIIKNQRNKKFIKKYKILKYKKKSLLMILKNLPKITNNVCPLLE